MAFSMATRHIWTLWAYGPDSRGYMHWNETSIAAPFLQDFIKNRVPANAPIGFWYATSARIGHSMQYSQCSVGIH